MLENFIKYYIDFVKNIEEITPKILWAFFILLFWWIISRIIYIIIKKILIKVKLNDWIIKFLAEDTAKKDKKFFSKPLKYDIIFAKSISYYIFILFFRLCISYLWITEIEVFLKDLTNYLPNLFVWVLIGFFGIRFADSVYTIVSHTLSFSKDKVAKVIAYWAKIIILFFTFMLVVSYTKIISEFVINTVIVGFISMLALAWWLAFWLWWKDIAKEILESFRK